MSALTAVLYRETKIRATNVTFIFWDLFMPLGYLLVFGVGVNESMGAAFAGSGLDYNSFFLAGALCMASFGIAANSSWSFFLDRDNGIFFEMLTYPMSRSQYLLGKVLFNVGIAVVQAALALALAVTLLDVRPRWEMLPLFLVAYLGGTAGWFYFYAIFALRIRRNDAFNTVTSIFYFVFLFASSMFYPIEPLPAWLRISALANPVTWHVDVLRYTTVGMGDPQRVAIEAAAFALFCFASMALAVRSLHQQE